MIVERSLTGDENDELKEAAESLGLDDLDAFSELLTAIDEGEVEVDDDLAFRIGAWWGRYARGVTGWKWMHLRFGEGLEAPALVDEARSIAVLPLQLAAEALAGEPASLRALADRLRKGDRPKGEPGTYALVM